MVIKIQEMKQKVAVIGGAGFIGSNLVDTLIESGEDVVVIDDLSTGKVENTNPAAMLHCIDISKISPGNMAKLLDGCKKVYYLAALARVQLSFTNVLRYNEVNLTGLLITLEAMKLASIKHLVYSSSSSVYADAEIKPTPETCQTNPISPYATQKLAAENYIKSYTLQNNIKAVCLRFFNVYGERMLTEGAYTTAIGKFLQKLKSGSPLEITNDGNQRRDFTYVGDVVRACIKSMDYLNLSHKKYYAFNVGTGKNCSINEIADLFPLKKIYIGDVIEPRETLADITSIKYTLGWTPTVEVLDWVSNEIQKIKE